MKKRRSVILLTVVAIIMVLVSGCSQAPKDKENPSDVPSDVPSSTPIDNSKTTQNDTSSGSDTTYFNEEYSETGMKTVLGDEFDYDNKMMFTKFGMAISSPVFQEFIERFSGGDAPDRIEFIYNTDKSLEVRREIQDEIKGKTFQEIDESVWKKFDQCTAIIGAVFCIKDNDENAKTIMDEFKGKFSIVESFAKNGEYTYYYAYNDDISAYANITLSDKDKADIEKLSKFIPIIPKNSCLFPGIDACGPVNKVF